VDDEVDFADKPDGCADSGTDSCAWTCTRIRSGAGVCRHHLGHDVTAVDEAVVQSIGEQSVTDQQGPGSVSHGSRRVSPGRSGCRPRAGRLRGCGPRLRE